MVSTQNRFEVTPKAIRKNLEKLSGKYDVESAMRDLMGVGSVNQRFRNRTRPVLFKDFPKPLEWRKKERKRAM